MLFFFGGGGGRRTDPSAVLSKRHPPSPDALHKPDLVDIVPLVGGRSRIAPRKWVAAAGRRGTDQTTRSGQIGMGAPRRRPYLPGQISPPILYPYIHGTAMAWLDRNGFNSKENP